MNDKPGWKSDDIGGAHPDDIKNGQKPVERAYRETGTVTNEKSPVPPLEKTPAQKDMDDVVKNADALIMPIVERIATLLGVEPIDNIFYEGAVPITDKSSCIFTILNRNSFFQTETHFMWEYFWVKCKGVNLVSLGVGAKKNDLVPVLYYVKLWENKGLNGLPGFTMCGDPEEEVAKRRVLKKEVVVEIIEGYLKKELGVSIPVPIIKGGN